MSDSTTPSVVPVKRASASRVKELQTCSLQYYYSRVKRIPSKRWPKTVMGSLAHVIFECLANPRHRKHYDLICLPKDGVDYRLDAAVERLVKRWQIKYGIEQKLIDELNGMLWVGLKLIDFHFTRADLDDAGQPRIWKPEHVFVLKLNDDSEVNGVIDRMAVINGAAVCRDFKSQGKRFTGDDMMANIQAFIYQLYIWKTFRLPARVEFVMLRHPPTSRTPNKHLQVVEPLTEGQLRAVEEHIKDLQPVFNAFGMTEAYSNLCQDWGFCKNVCSYYVPFDYWAVVKKDAPEAEAPIKTFPLDTAAQPEYAVKSDELLVKRHHAGCPYRWRPVTLNPPSITS